MERAISLITILGVVAISITLVIVIEYKQKESFTELYFTDFDALPKNMLIDKTYNVSFTIVSHEIKTKNYNVEIISPILNKTSPLTLLPDQNKTTKIQIIPKTPTNRSKFSIKTNNQEIYFYYSVK